MPTKTLIATKTDTITTTRMLTATLALALANVAALAMVPVSQKSVVPSAVSCPASNFSLEQSCGNNLYAGATFTCEGDTQQLAAEDGGKCLSVTQWQEKVDGWCQNQCTGSYYHEEEVTSE